MTTKDRRRIPEHEEQRLNRNVRAIKRDLDVSSGELMDCLITKGFRPDDADEIKKELHRENQIDLLLRRIRHIEGGFTMFVEALRVSRHMHLVSLLENDIEEFNKETQTSPIPWSEQKGLGQENYLSNGTSSFDVTDGPPLYSEDEGEAKDGLRDVGTSADESELYDDTALPQQPPYQPLLLHREEPDEYMNPSTQKTMSSSLKETSVTQKSERVIRFEGPSRLSGFGGSNVDTSSMGEYRMVEGVEGWYAGVSDSNIKTAISMASTQNNSYFVWFSRKIETVVLTTIDKNCHKGHVHFKMKRKPEPNKTTYLYYFDNRKHCRTPSETLNAAKKHGIIVTAEKVAKYYES